tara:strand:- start:140 stop:1456 length:1317 start_codon:yes stop_codon:yes gene_type:complete
MTQEVVVKIQKLGKKFKLYETQKDRLKEWLSFGFCTTHSDFWALKDISIEIKQGECFGIIGENGAGKSTLLKILTGALWPTSGSVEMRGRVFSLLELGTGFNMELTGKQNIINNASLLGFPDDYITQEKLDLIEQFADIGEFFNQPIRTYSSGMHVRLAFSMFMFMEPEIFIIDEALSVGDIFFSQKCFKQIRELMGRGVTFIFVSHDLNAIQNLSNKVMLLNHGECIFQGAPEQAVERYSTKTSENNFSEPTTSAFKKPLSAAKISGSQIDHAEIISHSVLDNKNRHGDRSLEIIAARIVNSDHKDTLSIPIMDHLFFYYLIRAQKEIQNPHLGISFFDRMNNLVFGKNTHQLGISLPSLKPGEEMIYGIKIKISLQPGQYTLSLHCGALDENNPNPNAGIVYDWHDSIGPIKVTFDYSRNCVPFNGIADLSMKMIN